MNKKKFHLKFLFLCDHALVEENKKLSIIGIFSIINLKKIPGVHLKSVLVGSFNVLDRKVKDLNIQVGLLDPDNKPVSLSIPPVELPITQREKKLRDVNFTLELGNLKFETGGEYKFEVTVNDELIGEYKFQVKHK